MSLYIKTLQPEAPELQSLMLHFCTNPSNKGTELQIQMNWIRRCPILHEPIKVSGENQQASVQNLIKYSSNSTFVSIARLLTWNHTYTWQILTFTTVYVCSNKYEKVECQCNEMPLFWWGLRKDGLRLNSGNRYAFS